MTSDNTPAALRGVGTALYMVVLAAASFFITVQLFKLAGWFLLSYFLRGL